MKKLLIFMIMLGVFLIPRYTTHGYSLDANDTPIAELNGLTLNEVFDRTILKHVIELPNGLKYYEVSGNSIVQNVGEFILLESHIVDFNTITFTNLDRALTNVDFNIIIETNSWTNETLSNMFINEFTEKVTPVIDDSTFYNTFVTQSNGRLIFNFEKGIFTTLLEVKSFLNGTEILYPIPTPITITTGISIDQSRLDYWYFEWLAIINYIDGYNQGNLDGYAEGLEDNTAYVQGYNVGYTDGLLGGADMETGSSIIVFVVGAIGFIMMIFGFTTKRRIFNLLSVGAFIVLGGLLAQYVGFIIITIGLVIVNVYYTFWGEI